MSPLTALFIFVSTLLALPTTAFLSYVFGSAQVFELAVVVTLIYFILAFVQYLRNYNKKHYT